MSKVSNKKKKSNKKKNIIDMSYRRNMNVNFDRTYSDEEFRCLLLELEEQMKEMELVEKYYSINACIERISERKFLDILKEKLESIYERNLLRQ